jgi:hypothetical protein
MGMGNLPNEDVAWLDGALKGLPTVAVPEALQQNILASFAAVTARRNSGVGNAMRRLAAAVWPGVPAWRPAVVLAFSLVIGVMAGTLVPLEDAKTDSGEQAASVALDAPPAFDLDESS